jgi:hypothetical protein
MVIKLAPGLVDAIADYLEANFEAVLQAEETIWNDGLPLPKMNTIARRDPDDPGKIANPPFMYVVANRTRIDDFRDDYALASHNLEVWIVAQATDKDVLRKLVYRYGNGLWKSLVKADGAGLGYRMATPESPTKPEIDYSLTLARGSMAMADVHILSWWGGAENDV